MASFLVGKIKYMQYKRIQRALEEPIYLLESDTSTYTIKIAGTTKNVYTVIYKPDLTCNCPDAKKRQYLCKHICFVICKICKIQDEIIFQTYEISDQQLIIIQNKLANIWFNKNIVDDVLCDLYGKLSTQASSKHNDTELVYDDDCAFCFNEITKDDQFKCTTCKKYVHQSCLQRWLERNSSCIFCRSKIIRPKIETSGEYQKLI
jgi:hypothetical protein